MALNGQNIKFLQGAYANLPKDSSQVGAFYVTNDTHELFLGLDANKAPVALNRWVDVEDSFSAITSKNEYRNHPGKIYYAKAENVLCTWDGNEWVQINPDTNTSLAKVEISDGKATTTAEGQKAVEYTLTFTQKDKKGENLANPLTANLVITDEIVTSLAVDVKVGVQAAVENGTATINTVGAGSDASKSFTVAGDNGVTIEGSDSGITVKGTTYGLSAGADATVILKDHKGETAGSVQFTDDDKWIKVEKVGETNVINIAHQKADTTSKKAVAVGKNNTGTAGDIDKTNRKFTAITAVNADDNGHIIDVDTTEFVIPSSDFTLTAAATEFTYGDSKDKYTTSVTLKDNNGGNLGTADIEVAFGIEIDGKKKIVDNSADNNIIGSFYSAEIIDEKLADIEDTIEAVNAMVYCGTVDGDEHPLPGVEALVKKGDTYKASADFTLANGTQVKVGDLLIANGTEVNGFISGNISWDLIESGERADTTYNFTASNNALNLTASAGDSSSVAVQGDDLTDLTASGNTLSVAHKSVTRTDSNGTAATVAPAGKIAAVTGVSTDRAGHVNGVTTTEFTIPEADTIAVGKHYLAINRGGQVEGKIAIDDGDLTNVTSVVSGKEVTIKVNHDTIVTTTEAAPVAENEKIALDGNGKFTVVDRLENDGHGHITKVITKEIAIDKEFNTTYALSGPNDADAATASALANANAVTAKAVEYVLTDSGNQTVGSINLYSDNLALIKKTVDGDNYVGFNLQWGTF